jgi:DNA-binding GntR family transcriptional regulator
LKANVLTLVNFGASNVREGKIMAIETVASKAAETKAKTKGKGKRASPVANKPASSEPVFQAIRDRIHAGRLVPGQRLIEADLVTELGTNRSRLREAFRRLESEGLVKIDLNKGASVRRISRQEMIDTLEVLDAVSVVMVDKAIDRHRDPAARRVLERALEQARSFRANLMAISQPRRFMDANTQFWDAFDEIQVNPVLSDTRRRLETTLYRVSLDGLVTRDRERWFARHEDLLRAVLSGDRRRSRKLREVLVHDVREAILALPDEAFVW